MANFFNNKKRLESEKEAEAKAQKDVFNEMANESSLLQIGKEQNYKKVDFFICYTKPYLFIIVLSTIHKPLTSCSKILYSL